MQALFPAPRRLTGAKRMLMSSLRFALVAFALQSPLPGFAETGVTEREILIGQFAALTGPAAELGKKVQNGILAQFEAVNAQGGINGRKLKLVSRDDSYEPEKALGAATALINEDKVFALIGSVGSDNSLAAVSLVNAEKIPLIGPVTGESRLRLPFSRQIFHVRASYADETDRVIQHLYTLGIKKIAVFYENSSFGIAGLEGVNYAMAKRSFRALASASVERNSVEVAASIDKILSAKPEAIVQIAAYKTSAAFIKAARAKGFGGQFVNVSFVGSRALANELGEAGVGVVISQVVPFPFQTGNRLVMEYQQAMTTAGHKEFDFSSLEGFIAAKVLTEGLQRAGKSLTRERLVVGLESLQRFDLGGFFINYSAQSHEGSAYTDMTLIGRDGKFVH